MKINFSNYTKLLFLVILVGLCFRLAYINIPLLETVPTRQCETASVARNFYKHGINVFSPEFDHYGNSTGVRIMEFGLVPVLAAIGYKIVGGVYEWIVRFISILFSIGTVLCLFNLVKQIYDEKTAFWAGFCFYLSPLSIIYSRTFQPESAMLFFTIAGMLSMYNFYVKEKKLFCFIGIISLALAILVKITALYILLPILYLVWNKQKNYKFIFDYKQWIIFFLILILPFCWYLRARMITMADPLHGTDVSFANYFSLKTLFTLKTWLNFAEYMAGKVLTPIGLIFFIKSVFKNKHIKFYGFFVSWLIGVIIYMILFCNTAFGHKYYYLPLLVICSIFIGIEAGKENFGFKKKINKNVKIILSVLIFVSIAGQLRSAYFLDDKYKYTTIAGKKLDEIAEENALVLATRRIYYCNRRGWRIGLSKDNQSKFYIKEIERYRKKGVKYFIVTELNRFDKQKEFKKYLEDKYKLIYQAEGFKIFKL